MVNEKLKFFLEANQTEYLSMLLYSGQLSEPDLELIANALQHEGKWREFGYNLEDDQYGYDGIIPACFWLISLCLNNQLPNAITEMLRHKTANALLDSVRSGSIRKTTFNHNDVLNTSLLAAYSLVVYSDTTQQPNSYKAKIIDTYARRIVYRAMLSQHRSGAFPYQSNSRHVSVLYHYMVVALLRKFNERWDDELLDCAIKCAQKFLEDTIINEDINWSKDTSNDKIGAVWAHFWLAATGCELPTYQRQLEKLQSGVMLHGETGIEDPRYTAWCQLAEIIKGKNLSGPIDISNRNVVKKKIRYILFCIDRILFQLTTSIKKLKIKMRHFIFNTGHELN
jgi:hypothetical protein